MAFCTSLPVDIVLEKVENKPDSIWCADGWVYRAGTYRSIIYPSQELAAGAIKKRFPAGMIDGQGVDLLFPTIKADVDPMPEMLPLPEYKPPAVVPPPTPGAKTTAPHVYVAGKDKYCLLCDNAEGSPLHVHGSIAKAKRGKKGEVIDPIGNTAPPVSNDSQKSLW